MENDIKKIIIFTDLTKYGFTLAQKLLLSFLDDKVKIIFYSVKSKKFLDGQNEIHSLNNLLKDVDFIVNLIPSKYSASRDIDGLAKKMGIFDLGNSFNTKLLFFSKNNLKKIFQKNNIKTPTFRFLGNDNEEQAFSNFPQPSRIFSKSNNYFSGKIDSIEKMKKVFQEIGDNKSNYLIEEYINGEDIYSLVLKNEDVLSFFNQYTFLKNNNIDILEKEINKTSQKIFNTFEIEKFALIHYKINKIGSIFVLNIFVDFNILLGEKGDILEKILKDNDLKINYFLNNLKNNNKNKKRNTLLEYL